MRIDADIDIDFADRNQILKLIRNVPARQESNTETKQHNSGVYVTDVPLDPLHNCASIDYKEADERGYFKIDFLNVSVYQHIKDIDHYNKLLSQNPPWEKLLDRNFSSQVVHLGNHSHALESKKPDSIAKMAMFLALIRPAKKHLLRCSWKDINEEIWNKPSTNEYHFKHAHAISYAMLVALHMNIIAETY